MKIVIFFLFAESGALLSKREYKSDLFHKFTYLGNNVSSTEKDIVTRLMKAWTAIDRLSIIWKSDLTDKMKRSFFQAAVVSILLYGCTTWTLTIRRPARTYIQQLCEDTGCNPEDLPKAMNDREKWRERVRDIRAGGTTWLWCLYLAYQCFLEDVSTFLSSE